MRAAAILPLSDLIAALHNTRPNEAQAKRKSARNEKPGELVIGLSQNLPVVPKR